MSIENKNLFPITSNINKEGHLTIGGVSTVDLAKKYGTPLYIIDKETLLNKANEYISSFKKHYNDFLILYAAKAFSATAIFKLVNSLGLGLDVVSGGELYSAMKSGFDFKNIFFHGNNKSKDEIELGIKNDIGRIVCDNFYEIELLKELGKKHKKKINILLRLTPGIECHTHEYIKTGHLDSKFGFDLEHYEEALKSVSKSNTIKLKGLHAHIGSQIFEVTSYTDMINILLEQFKLTKEKYNIDLDELNIGGGIGIAYIKNDDPFIIDSWVKNIANSIKSKCHELNINQPRLICEPGRSLIGTSGITLYTTGSTKQVPDGRKYISVDGGMADNPRPITYSAQYSAVVANKINNKDTEKITIAGRYCESGDILIKDIELPKIQTGDIIAVLGTGAYNYSMSSNYNMVPRPACILVDKGTAQIIIERETYDDLIAKHKIPANL